MGRKRKSLFVLALSLLLSAIIFLFANNQVPELSPSTNQKAIPAPILGTCGNLTIYILNVSQADSIFIITPGNKTILIDAGSAMKPNSSDRVVEFLKKMNISRIDYLIASHYHEDHIGGMEKVFANAAVGKIFDNGNCANISTRTAEKFFALRSTADTLVVRDMVDLPSDGCFSQAKLIFPLGNDCSTDENENSILLHLTFGNTSFLFTGDCGGDCESAIVQKGIAIHSDFLKIGHHGSSTSSSNQFLDAVGAGFYVISVDKTRSVTDGYFHPRAGTLEKIYQRSGASLFRTDLNGEIKAVSDGGSIIIFPEQNADECDIFSGYAASDVNSYSSITQLSSRCG